MAYSKRESGSNSEVKDYKARFEFVLTTTNSQSGEENIICQRYFKIGDFNPLCSSSSRLRDAIIRCAKIINVDLTEKSAIYTSLMAPRVFKSEEEMNSYLAVPAHCKDLVQGEGIVISDPTKPNYVWTNNGPKVSPTKFNKYEFAHESSDDDVTKFTLTFKDHASFFVKDGETHILNPIGNEEGRILASYTWTNILPKIIKSSIDLSNKAGRANSSDVNTLNGESWVLYKMTEGRTDLVWKIVKELCGECCVKDDTYYTEADPFGSEQTIQSVLSY